MTTLAKITHRCVAAAMLCLPAGAAEPDIPRSPLDDIPAMTASPAAPPAPPAAPADEQRGMQAPVLPVDVPRVLQGTLVRPRVGRVANDDLDAAWEKYTETITEEKIRLCDVFRRLLEKKIKDGDLDDALLCRARLLRLERQGIFPTPSTEDKDVKKTRESVATAREKLKKAYDTARAEVSKRNANDALRLLMEYDDAAHLALHSDVNEWIAVDFDRVARFWTPSEPKAAASWKGGQLMLTGPEAIMRYSLMPPADTVELQASVAVKALPNKDDFQAQMVISVHEDAGYLLGTTGKAMHVRKLVPNKVQLRDMPLLLKDENLRHPVAQGRPIKIRLARSADRLTVMLGDPPQVFTASLQDPLAPGVVALAVWNATAIFDDVQLRRLCPDAVVEEVFVADGNPTGRPLGTMAKPFGGPCDTRLEEPWNVYETAIKKEAADLRTRLEAKQQEAIKKGWTNDAIRWHEAITSLDNSGLIPQEEWKKTDAAFAKAADDLHDAYKELQTTQTKALELDAAVRLRNEWEAACTAARFAARNKPISLINPKARMPLADWHGWGTTAEIKNDSFVLTGTDSGLFNAAMPEAADLRLRATITFEGKKKPGHATIAICCGPQGNYYLQVHPDGHGSVNRWEDRGKRPRELASFKAANNLNGPYSLTLERNGKVLRALLDNQPVADLALSERDALPAGRIHLQAYETKDSKVAFSNVSVEIFADTQPKEVVAP